MKSWCVAFGLWVGIGSLSFASEAASSQVWNCRAVYERTMVDSWLSRDTTTIRREGWVEVRLGELKKLPAEEMLKAQIKSPEGTPFGGMNFTGAVEDIVNKRTVTYEGAFSHVVRNEWFTLHDTLSLGAGDGATRVAGGILTAKWSMLSGVGTRTSVNKAPFAVVVSLWDRHSNLRGCRFTGKRITEADSFFGRKEVTHLTDVPVRFESGPCPEKEGVSVLRVDAVGL